jgi:hypothetical protein
MIAAHDAGADNTDAKRASRRSRDLKTVPL